MKKYGINWRQKFAYPIVYIIFVLDSVDIFVASSITTNSGEQEGLGLTLIGAMASGLPVVTSDSGGISQLITNEINGLLCKEKDVEQLVYNVNRLLHNGDLYDRITKNMQTVVKECDYAVIGRKYSQILEDVV